MPPAGFEPTAPGLGIQIGTFYQLLSLAVMLQFQRLASFRNLRKLQINSRHGDIVETLTIPSVCSSFAPNIPSANLDTESVLIVRHQWA